MKRTTAILFLAVMLLFPGIVRADAAVPGIETDVTGIQKYGNLELGITASDLLALGYEYGDVVSVTVNGQTMEMPVGSNYSDVDTGRMLCRVVLNESEGQDVVILAINMGDLATALGIAVKTATEEEPGYRWDYQVDGPVSVAISMSEKGGYADEYLIHQLTRSVERADYPDLTDAEYANFRNVATTGMGAGALYRSSSPVNPEINRAREADEALNGAGIRTIMNLADSEETMRGYEDFAGSYYSQRDVIALNLGVDFASEDFRAGLAAGIAFFASHEGPYLVHCTEGKDRAGFVSAVLECLMGATADEVAADYMETYRNYYGVEPGTEQYEAVLRSNIAKSLAAAFGIEDFRRADLALCAEEYLLGIGVSPETIDALRENLAASYWE